MFIYTLPIECLGIHYDGLKVIHSPIYIKSISINTHTHIIIAEIHENLFKFKAEKY